MSQYDGWILFQLLDGTGADATELELQFDTLDDARYNAKATLCEMEREGLPDNLGEMMSVEIFDADKISLVELR